MSQSPWVEDNMSVEDKCLLTDTVFIEGLAVETVVGVYEWEKRIRQKLVFDIQLRTEVSRAASQDAIDLTIDYAGVAEKVTSMVSRMKVELVETVAEQVADMLLTSFPIRSVKIKLSKPGAVANADNVGVIIERTAI